MALHQVTGMAAPIDEQVGKVGEKARGRDEEEGVAGWRFPAGQIGCERWLMAKKGKTMRLPGTLVVVGTMLIGCSSNWKLVESKSEMDDSVRHSVTTLSPREVKHEKGDPFHPWLSVAFEKGKTSIRAVPGQWIEFTDHARLEGALVGTGSVKVRFDEEEPMQAKMMEIPNSSRSGAYIGPEDELLRKMLKHKSMKIQWGAAIDTFNLDGLQATLLKLCEKAPEACKSDTTIGAALASVGVEIAGAPKAAPEQQAQKETPTARPAAAPAPPPTESPAKTLAASCDAGNPQACASLADLISQGPGASGQQPKALVLLERACAGGVVNACKRGAEMYRRGEGSAPDPAKAVNLLKHACDARDVPACTLVAIALRSGDGVPQDLTEAAKLFDFACDGDNGTGSACVLLALAYENGAGVAKDLNRALAIYERGCAAKDQELCGALGGFLMEAPPPIGDAARGRSLSEKACQLGNQAACQWLRQVGPAVAAAAGINLASGTFAATTPQWKAARDAVLVWCGANAGKCTEQALGDLGKPADGILKVGAGAKATLTTCSPGNCPGASFVEFKKSGAAWSITKVEWSPMGD